MFTIEKHHWPLSADIDIPVSSERVWKQMIEPASTHIWHPFVKENSCEKWHGTGSKDKITYYNGITFDREIVDWIEGTGFDLDVGENGIVNGKAVWRITPIDDNNCNLDVTTYLRVLDKFPLPIRWTLHHLKVKPSFQKYLKLALKGFAFHATTGERTKRNQFGPHPLFSPNERSKT